MRLVSLLFPLSLLASTSLGVQHQPHQQHTSSSSPQEIPPLHGKYTTENEIATRFESKEKAAGLAGSYVNHGRGIAFLPSRSLSDWKLEHVLLATIEGELSMLNRHSGQEVWRVAFDGQPMVEIQYNKNEDQKFPLQWVVEPNNDGNIYVVVNDEIQKLAYSIRELADIYSPWEDKDMPFVYTAKKENSILTLNATNGEILKVFSPGDFTIPNSNSCRKDDCPQSPTITVGRTTYTVSIQHRESGAKACLIHYSEWTPNVRDQDLYRGYTSSMDNKYVYTQRNGRAYAVEHKPNSKQAPLYHSQFKSPVVQVFDVASSPDVDVKGSALALLPQPTPPALDKKISGKIYVSITNEGSLYALSEENYPSVTDGAYNAHLPDEVIGVHDLLNGGHIPVLGGGPSLSGSPTSVGGIIPSRFPGLLDPPPPPPLTIPSGHEDTLTRIPRWKISVPLALILIACISAYPFYSASIHKIFAPHQHMVKSITPSADKIVEPTPVDTTKGSVDTLATPKAQPAIPKDVVEELDIVTPNRVDSMATDNGSDNQADANTQDDGPDDDADGTENNGKLKKKARRGKRGKKGGKNQKNAVFEPDAPVPRLLAENSGLSLIEKIAQQTLPPEPEIQPDFEMPEGVTDISELRFVKTAPEFVYQANQIIGTGMQGTHVYSGWHKHKVVAIKRMLKTQFAVESTEVSTLRKAEHHKNIINYYGNASDADFLYIALEKCQASLDDLFLRGYDTIRPDIAHLAAQMHVDIKGALYQLIDGLSYLHKLRIIHRDIKPQNILIAYPETSKDTEIRLVISDFGLSRTLNEERSTLATGIVTGAGTMGWKAPEVMRKASLRLQAQLGNPPTSESTATGTSNSNADSTNAQGVKRAADIFPLACVFYFMVTKGYHPFDEDGPEEGALYKREINILDNKRNFSRLEKLGPEGALLQDMIESMLCEDPHKRPAAADIKAHPYFWRTLDQLNFLCEFSDRLDALIKAQDPAATDIIKKLESQAPSIISDKHGNLNWRGQLDKKLSSELSTRRTYQPDRIEHLLRAIRNKKIHYYEASPEVMQLFGNSADVGFMRYWMVRFPKLLMHLVWVVGQCGMGDILIGKAGDGRS